MATATVLVVDDELRSLEALRRVLAEEFEVLCARNTAEAEALLQAEMVHVILCDQRMPGEAGVAFLKRVRELWPAPVRMIISGYADSEDVIAGVNEAGIHHYITKPWHPEELMATVREAVQLFRLQRQTEAEALGTKPAVDKLQALVSEKRRVAGRLFDFERIVHAPTSPMKDIIALARNGSRFDISVLITGESGTGKELLARAVHYSSGRADQPFVVQNCGALPDELLESELFGCKKGVFTGAYQDRIGLFEVASGGTIFLDEIGETSPAFQVKLLRVLQESEIRPLGAQRVRKVNVRVVAATNKDIEQEVAQGRFRRDLYYRLSAFPIHMPALRDRAMDIPCLADHILAEVSASFKKPITGITPEAMRHMQAYPWLGNVRELQNEIQRMAVLAETPWLGPELLSSRLTAQAGQGDATMPAAEGKATLKDRVELLERDIILDAVTRHQGNISRVADELGLSRVGLRSKLSRYDLGSVVGHGRTPAN